MRFGKWRGVPLTFALAAILGMSSTSARADGWHLHYTIPREVPAYDYTTGGPYYAPPVPYGHYAKDYYGDAVKATGMLTGCFGDLWNKTVGLFHHGDGDGEGCGAGQDCGGGNGSCLGHGCGGLGAGGVASNDCGFCAGHGLFHHGNGGILGAGSCLDGNGPGLGHKKHFAPCHSSTVAATGQVQPAGQTVIAPTAQSACGYPGCKIGGLHSHLGNLMNKIHCRFCGGGGCGACGGIGMGDPCASCGGCGLFGGLGHGGKLCGACGGCGLGHGGGLASKAHGLLGHLTGMIHHDKMDWFVGAGGPVPLTPGYVPYIVTTRSPRDYFAFPPMNPNDP
jgi:hypothetical protein